MKVEAYACAGSRPVQVDITPFLDDLHVKDIELLRQEDRSATIFHENGEEDSYHFFNGRVTTTIRRRVVTDGALDAHPELKRRAIRRGFGLYVNHIALNDYYLNRVGQDAVDSLLDNYELRTVNYES